VNFNLGTALPLSAAAPLFWAKPLLDIIINTNTPSTKIMQDFLIATPWGCLPAGGVYARDNVRASIALNWRIEG
jgi:hypothetical protein